MRAAGVPGRGENGKDVQEGQAAVVDEPQRVREHGLGLGREAGDQVGAEDDVGPQPPHLCAEAHRHRRGEWRRFMRLRIMSSPACSDRCRCGIRRGSSAMASHQMRVGLDLVDGGQAQALELGHVAQDVPHELAEASCRPADRRRSR